MSASSNKSAPSPDELLALARAALAEPDFQIPRIGIFGTQSWIDYRNATANPAVIAALCERLERACEFVPDYEPDVFPIHHLMMDPLEPSND